jgi:hypothetical protein
MVSRQQVLEQSKGHQEGIKYTKLKTTMEQTGMEKWYTRAMDECNRELKN